MSDEKIQRCIDCEEPTGRGAEDAIYDDLTGEGPLCERHQDHRRWLIETYWYTVPGEQHE